MRILLAQSNRDLLFSMKKLLEMEGYEVTAVFDGIKVFHYLAEKKTDLVLADAVLPRIKKQELIQYCNQEDIPVIIMEHQKMNSKLLSSGTLANAYLSFPFLPNELNEMVLSVMRKKQSGRKIVYEDIEVNEAAFLLCRQVRLTNEEIDVLRSLIENREFNAKKMGVYLNSLNNKMIQLNKKLRIRYVMKEGYRLVKENEES